MSTLSLSKRLTNKPSRSYLPSDDGRDRGDNGSILSGGSRGSYKPSSYLPSEYRKGGSVIGDYLPRRDDGARFNSLPAGLKLGSRTAASDVGAGGGKRTGSLLGTIGQSAGRRLTRERQNSIDSQQSRRSVTFSDLNPALFDDSSPKKGRQPERRGIMSDVGGYRQPLKGILRAPSITSMDDNMSETASVMSATKRNYNRGSRSERTLVSSSSQDWHRDLGGPGAVKLSRSASLKSTTNGVTDIIKRKSTGKVLDLANATPSRRYSTTVKPTDGHQVPPVPSSPLIHTQNVSAVNDNDDQASTRSSSTTSEVSYAQKNLLHSRHTAKQRRQSGLDALPAADSSESESQRAPALRRSASSGSAASTKQKRAVNGPVAGLAPKPKLSSSGVENTLLTAPVSAGSKKSKEKSPEQIVDALSRAGLLDRVMEVVNEVDEDEAGSEVGIGSSNLQKQTASNGPANAAAPGQPKEVIPQVMVTSATIPDLYQASQAPALPAQQSADSESTVHAIDIPLVPKSDVHRQLSTISERSIPTDRPASAASTDRDNFQTPTSEMTVNPLSLATPYPASAVPVSSTPVSVYTNGATETQAAPPVNKPESNGAILTAPTLQQRSISETIVAPGTLPMPDHSNPVRLESLAVSSGPTASSGRQIDGTLLARRELATDSATAAFRLTWNAWESYEEALAKPVQVNDQTSEYSRFNFTWLVPPGSREMDIQLALRLEDGSGRIYWDNNGGGNYQVKVPAGSRTPSPRPSPSASNVALSLSSSEAVAPAVPPRNPARATPPNVGPVVLAPGQLPPPAEKQGPSEAGRNSDDGLPRSLAATGLPVSGIPFPTGPVSQTTTSLPVPTSPGLPPEQHIADEERASALPKYITQSTAASTASGSSSDSTNQPYTYPSRRSSASTSQAAPYLSSSQFRQRPASPVSTMDMPSIMTALDKNPALADDLSGIYRTDQPNGTLHANQTNQGLLPARSVISDAGSTSGQSASGLSIPKAGYSSGSQVIKSDPQVALASNNITLPGSNTTMKSLSVTSNAAQSLNRSFFRKYDNTKLRQTPQKGGLPSHLSAQNASNAVIAFSNLTPVPMKIRSDECLVHVFASALDFWDRAKVEILCSRGQGYGFIPGRAFVGRVVETGTDVDKTKVKTGDFVYGLNELKKSGALGEYLAVNRGLLARAPNGVLSIEQIAAVALSGIASYQAMDELCHTLTKGAKLIIVNAHEGVGALALQLARSLRPAHDLWLVAHYPADFADGDAILRQLGASETLCGDVLSALASLRESSYDAILDSVGGRRVYDAAKRVLHDDAYFVTTVGDALSVPTTNAQWKRSFKAIFGRREKKKHIGYWFPSIEQDQRAALDRLREICEAGMLKPVVKRVYKYEDGPNAFKGPNEQAVIMLLDSTS